MWKFGTALAADFVSSFVFIYTLMSETVLIWITISIFKWIQLWFSTSVLSIQAEDFEYLCKVLIFCFQNLPQNDFLEQYL